MTLPRSKSLFLHQSVHFVKIEYCKRDKITRKEKECVKLYCFIGNLVEKTLKTVTSQVVHNNNRSEKLKLIEINLRSVIATTSAGGGLTSLRKFCTDLNFPEPVTENSYNRYLHNTENFAIENYERSMKKAAQELRTLILNDEPDIDQVLDVAVSVDGSWQKRYEHNIMNGIRFFISIDTGCVLDYVVKTKFWHVCKANPNASE